MKTFSSFMKKLIRLFSLEFILYIIICGWNMQEGLIFSESLEPMKSCLSKGSLLDTTISLISISFIKIGLLF